MVFVDFNLDLLVQVVRIIDEHLDTLGQRAVQEDDADALGYYDSMEHITGLGFVACQTYMSSVYGFHRLGKQMALASGPIHAGGLTKAQIINQAANYWKHNSEWLIEKNDKQRKLVEETFESVGFPVGTDYPLSGVLAELTNPHPAAFRPLVATLTTWRDVVMGRAA